MAGKGQGEPQPIEYRAATVDDAEQIAQLHAASWRRTYRGTYSNAFLDGDLIGNRRGVWLDRLTRYPADLFVCVAVSDDALAGFVCACGAEDEQWGSLIDNLHVDRDFQRSGVGAALVRRAGAWLAVSYADCGVYLWVLEGNSNARRFYERLGATHAETVENVLSSGDVGRSCRYVWSSPDTPALPITREPSSMIEALADAQSRGEHPNAPTIMRPGEGESEFEFLSQLFEAIHGRPANAEERAELAGEADGGQRAEE